MSRRARAADAIVLGVFAATFAIGMASVAAGPPQLPTTVEIRIRYSRFDPAALVVPHGRPVTFVLRNEDPIDHEWIVGDAAVHDRHRTGTEPVHAARPTEVSVPAGERRTTTLSFPAGVEWTFVCHLPGHEAYGMVGTVVVRP